MSENKLEPVRPITVRAAVREDVTFLRKMIWQAIVASPTLIAEYGEENVVSHEESYWKLWPSQPAPDPAFIAVDATGRDLGGLTLKPNDENTPVSGWRIGIGVISPARGQGVGQALIERAIEFAAAKGATYLNLSVDYTNKQAIALYKRCGFVEDGEWDRLLRMRLTLAGIK